jgi:8-oxo-dGTP diphosphatase
VVALRPWRPADADALAAAWLDPLVVRFTEVPHDRSREAAAAWIAEWDDRLRLGLTIDLVITPAHDDTTVAGEVGVVLVGQPGGHGAIGWWMGAPFRGAGWATRAVDLVTRWALDAAVARVLVADVSPDNPASAAVVRRAGFQEVLGRWVAVR